MTLDGNDLEACPDGLDLYPDDPDDLWGHVDPWGRHIVVVVEMDPYLHQSRRRLAGFLSFSAAVRFDRASAVSRRRLKVQCPGMVLVSPV